MPGISIVHFWPRADALIGVIFGLLDFMREPLAFNGLFWDGWLEPRDMGAERGLKELRFMLEVSKQGRLHQEPARFQGL